MLNLKWLLYFLIPYLHKGNCEKKHINFIPTTSPTRNTIFVPQVISKTCTLKPDRGPCRGGINMYYYDLEKKECVTFEWGGCQGNGNRFNTAAECSEKCLSKRGAKKPRPNFCSLTYDYGYCFGALERYYYDHIWQICKKTIYSGCGGNDNNFLYLEQCESVCQYGTGFISQNRQKPEKYKKRLIVNPDKEAIKYMQAMKKLKEANETGTVVKPVKNNDVKPVKSKDSADGKP